MAKEFWDHAEHFEWQPDAFYKHVYRLASTLVSTKESLEDVIGDISDHVKRDQKNPN